ncbi:hypothetical protein DPMN_047219 [Dreissena polymorpha]|uniref:Uncharacterized protein n=1 Tax=Dreissena polymorpha TaxID=45954 RepID=A0A9D4I1A4_DREPO|nr:hypothetical protein DPMN_047219 [Dreissena polymorpha]
MCRVSVHQRNVPPDGEEMGRHDSLPGWRGRDRLFDLGPIAVYGLVNLYGMSTIGYCIRMGYCKRSEYELVTVYGSVGMGYCIRMNTSGYVWWVNWVNWVAWVNVYGVDSHRTSNPTLFTGQRVSYFKPYSVNGSTRIVLQTLLCLRVNAYRTSNPTLFTGQRVSYFKPYSVYGSTRIILQTLLCLQVDSYRTSNSTLFTGRLVSYFKPYFVYRSTLVLTGLMVTDMTTRQTDKYAPKTLIWSSEEAYFSLNICQSECVELPEHLSKRDTTETCEPFVYLIKRHATLRVGTAGTLSSRVPLLATSWDPGMHWLGLPGNE